MYLTEDKEKLKYALGRGIKGPIDGPFPREAWQIQDLKSGTLSRAQTMRYRCGIHPLSQWDSIYAQIAT
jgi:hypothetical protein